MRDSSSSLYTVRNELRIRWPRGTLARQQRRRQLYCLRSSSQSCLGNFPESRETHLRCIRCRPRGLSRTFYLPYDVGAHPGHPTQRDWQFLLILEIRGISATSIQHHYRCWHLYMRVVLIKHDPRGIFLYRGAYPRKRFRVADNALLYYRAPHYRDSSHIAVTPCFTCFLHSALTSKGSFVFLVLSGYHPHTVIDPVFYVRSTTTKPSTRYIITLSRVMTRR